MKDFYRPCAASFIIMNSHTMFIGEEEDPRHVPE